jgi:type I restriction enzyme S subunit
MKTVELLDKYFETAFSAPDGIKRLRELILTLAMQGKLVPQNPKERSASELLQTIKTWKKQKIQQKVFLKSKQIKPIDRVSLKYKIPQSWELLNIGDICGSIVPNRDKPKSFSGGYPWVTLSNFNDQGIQLLDNHSGEGLSEEEVRNYNARIIPKNSVLMSCVGRFGLVAVLDRDVVTNQQIHGFVVPEMVSSEYIAYIIKSQKSFLENNSTATTVSYLNKTKCESIPLPLPPLEEQHRIVEKIDPDGTSRSPGKTKTRTRSQTINNSRSSKRSPFKRTR